MTEHPDLTARVARLAAQMNEAVVLLTRLRLDAEKILEEIKAQAAKAAP